MIGYTDIALVRGLQDMDWLPERREDAKGDSVLRHRYVYMSLLFPFALHDAVTIFVDRRCLAPQFVTTSRGVCKSPRLYSLFTLLTY